jgi:LuxR family maltose regulon positive regulatory protein
LAAENYRRVLQLVGDPPWPAACEAHLGLARVHYQWNDLEAAERFGQQSLQLALRMENVDTPAACEVFLALLKLARGDLAGAASTLAQADQFVRQHNSVSLMPEVAAAQVLTLLHQGNLAAAAHLARAHELPISQARVYLAQGETSAALAVLEPLRQQVEANGRQDERLKMMVLQVAALHAHGEKAKAVQLLGDALALAEPGGLIRIFVDEGSWMAQLISEAAAHGVIPNYTGKLLAAFEAEAQPGLAGRQASQGKREDKSDRSHAQPPIEPLSQRELEILQLVAQGLSNREISERLFLALDTVKGHNRIIFNKLQVHNRTEAVARARELGLL